MPLSQLVQAARLRGAHAAGVRRRRRVLPSTLLLLHKLSSPLGGTLGFLLVLHHTLWPLNATYMQHHSRMNPYLRICIAHAHTHTARTHLRRRIRRRGPSRGCRIRCRPSGARRCCHLRCRMRRALAMALLAAGVLLLLHFRCLLLLLRGGLNLISRWL